MQPRQGQAPPQGSLGPPSGGPSPQTQQGGPYAGNGQQFGGNTYQGQVNNPTAYPQSNYQNPYPQQQGYSLQQQQGYSPQQQQQHPPYGNHDPMPYSQTSGYPPPAQQYPSSHQANVSSQGYGPGYGADKGTPGGSPDEAQGGERGLGTFIVGGTIGRKVARKADLGPVGILAAGIVGAQVLGNLRERRKHEKERR